MRECVPIGYVLGILGAGNFAVPELNVTAGADWKPAHCQQYQAEGDYDCKKQNNCFCFSHGFVQRLSAFPVEIITNNTNIAYTVLVGQNKEKSTTLGGALFFGSGGWIRTSDPLINSQLLYR